MARGKPSLAELNRFVPEISEKMIAFAEAATDTIVPVVPVAPVAEPVAPNGNIGSEKAPVSINEDPSLSSVEIEHKNERRIQISLKLDESFYWEIRAASLARTKKTGKRVSVQDILEKLIVDNFQSD